MHSLITHCSSPEVTLLSFTFAGTETGKIQEIFLKVFSWGEQEESINYSPKSYGIKLLQIKISR